MLCGARAQRSMYNLAAHKGVQVWWAPPHTIYLKIEKILILYLYLWNDEYLIINND